MTPQELAREILKLSPDERLELELALKELGGDTLELQPGTVLEPRGWPEPANLPSDYWESAE